VIFFLCRGRNKVRTAQCMQLTTRNTTETATPSFFSTLLMWFHVSPTLRWRTMAATGTVTRLPPRASHTWHMYVVRIENTHVSKNPTRMEARARRLNLGLSIPGDGRDDGSHRTEWGDWKGVREFMDPQYTYRTV